MECTSGQPRKPARAMITEENAPVTLPETTGAHIAEYRARVSPLEITGAYVCRIKCTSAPLPAKDLPRACNSQEECTSGRPETPQNLCLPNRLRLQNPPWREGRRGKGKEGSSSRFEIRDGGPWFLFQFLFESEVQGEGVPIRVEDRGMEAGGGGGVPVPVPIGTRVGGRSSSWRRNSRSERGAVPERFQSQFRFWFWGGAPHVQLVPELHMFQDQVRFWFWCGAPQRVLERFGGHYWFRFSRVCNAALAPSPGKVCVCVVRVLWCATHVPVGDKADSSRRSLHCSLPCLSAGFYLFVFAVFLHLLFVPAALCFQHSSSHSARPSSTTRKDKRKAPWSGPKPQQTGANLYGRGKHDSLFTWRTSQPRFPK